MRNIFIFDCRPMKQACQDILESAKSGEIDACQAESQLRELARGLAYDFESFGTWMGMSISTGNFIAARDIINKIPDQQLRAWPFMALFLAVFIVLPWLIFWMATLAIRDLSG